MILPPDELPPADGTVLDPAPALPMHWNKRNISASIWSQTPYLIGVLRYKKFQISGTPEGMSDSDGVVGISGVSSEEFAGAGEVAAVVDPLPTVPPFNKSFNLKSFCKI